MRVWTAKGHHDYLWAPSALKLGNGLGTLQGRFDGGVRAGNAYVIGPGALHATGVVYELDDPERPPVFAPGWLLTALTTQPPRTPARTPRWDTSGMASTGASRRAESLLAFVRASQKGARHNRLFWAACRAAEAGIDIRDELLAAAVQAGHGEGNALSTIRSAYNRTGATA